MSLPLQERATAHHPHFRLLTESAPSVAAREVGLDRSLVPAIPPGPGEQYRFHFDMTKCIGCHCCEVACNEQNNLPAHLHWRRVGEIEGGTYPLTQRAHLSMGCNHCLEPSCLLGCPVDAYTKDTLTGLVLHSADACIGCQYCIWNCPYGVPQYNEERGVVGKCDMCHGRLAEGRAPACVSACPEEAIRIEVVNVAAWRADYAASANAPGMPSADQTISTTRVSLPAALPTDAERADMHRVRPEHAHAPLVVMTVLTQLSVGAFAALFLLHPAGSPATQGMRAMLALALGHVALAVSMLHLGRPIHAYRALRMWRRSWLSREVLLFTLFAAAATAYSATLWLGGPAELALGALTALFGVGGIAASAALYRVPARPAWNSLHTPAEFLLTAMLLGPSLLLLTGARDTGLIAAAVAGGAAQLLNLAVRFVRLTASEEFERRASARLLASELDRLFYVRLALLLVGGVVAPLAGWFWAALPLALTGEFMGRTLFFVSVVPRNIAATYLGSAGGQAR